MFPRPGAVAQESGLSVTAGDSAAALERLQAVEPDLHQVVDIIPIRILIQGIGTQF